MKIAVILFNLGGPDKLENVEPFLFNLFNDPAILNLPSFIRYPLAKLISKHCPDPSFFQTDYFILEHNCISQLNILSNNSIYHSKFNSVFDVLNKTSTAMGFRLLQYRISRPIIKPELLEHRYNIIKSLIGTSDQYSPHI